MNQNDLLTLENYDERYTPVNMTAFRIIRKDTTKQTVVNHIRTDLDILNSCSIKNKHVSRIILRDNIIDICTKDNGTFTSYLFTSEAQFLPSSITKEINNLCDEYNISEGVN